MKTTLLTAALLTTLLVGCSKEENTEIKPVETTTTGQIVRTRLSLPGTYTVLKFSREGQDAFDEMKNLRLYVYKEGQCETVVNRVNNKGTYKFDNVNLVARFVVTGNKESDILSSREWKVARLSQREIKLFSDEGSLVLILYLNYPSDANPL